MPLADPARCVSHFNGSWQQNDNAKPAYRAGGADFTHDTPISRRMASSPMCHRQQSWKWQWRSQDATCPFHWPTRSQMCRRLARSRVLLFGDSLTQQLVVSLASMAGNASSAWKPEGCQDMKHLECIRVCGSQTANICHRTNFGLALDDIPDSFGNCSTSLRPSDVSPLAKKFAPSCLRRFDLIVLSEGAHWVGNDGAIGLEQCLVQQGVAKATARSQSQDWIGALFEKQMARNAAFLHANVAPARESRTSIFFRTLAPGLPSADILTPDTPGGSPPTFTAPARRPWVDTLVTKGYSAYNHHLIPRFNAIARRAYAMHAPQLGVIDVADPMERRVDGHLDALHYCLPGPPDWYSAVMWNYLLLPRGPTPGSDA